MSVTKTIENNFRLQQCPVCGSGNNRVVYQNLIRICNVLRKSEINLANEDVKSEILKCLDCGHKYSSLILKDEVLEKYYFKEESEYYDQVRAGSYLVNWDEVDKVNAKLVKVVAENAPPGGRVLEIGCGMGRLLYKLKEGGYECYGVEPSKYARDFGVNNFGLEVVNGFLDHNTFNFKFDLIVLSDVVEHISNINSILDLIYSYLSPNGKVVILTGDSNSLYSKVTGKKWQYFYSWEHISFFNRESIQHLFGKHSLRLSYFKNIFHSGSFWQNIKIVILTAKGMVFNFAGIRKSRFYYMAFDHFIAVGSKSE